MHLTSRCTGKTDKIKIREEVLAAVENHRINLSKIDDEKLWESRVEALRRIYYKMKSGLLKGLLWVNAGIRIAVCRSIQIVSEIEDGDEKMRMLIQSEKVQNVICKVAD